MRGFRDEEVPDDERGRDEEVDALSTRARADFVVSGPILGLPGRGRGFPTLSDALEWAKAKYGADRVRPIDEAWNGVFRWAILIKHTL